MAAKPTLEAIALLGEFGFEFVATDQVGEPTPGRIADRLSEIITALEDANARGNPNAVHQATEKLKRLQQAIDVWSLLASQLDDDQPTAMSRAALPQAAFQAPPPPPQLAQVPPPAPPVQMTPPPPPPVQAAPPPPSPPVQLTPPPPPPVQMAPPSPPTPPPVQAAPPVPPPPVQAPPSSISDYPPPPVPHHGPIDVEQLEKAAAGTQQALWQAIGQAPAGDKNKK